MDRQIGQTDGQAGQTDGQIYIYTNAHINKTVGKKQICFFHEII